MYYYGVKLHLQAHRVLGGLPVPQGLILTPASENDLNVMCDNWSDLPGCLFFADKACLDSDMQQAMSELQSELFVPVKYPKGVPEEVKQRNKAADDLFLRAVSAVRHPIEALFAWLLEKSDIPKSLKGAFHKRAYSTHLFKTIRHAKQKMGGHTLIHIIVSY